MIALDWVTLSRISEKIEIGDEFEHRGPCWLWTGFRTDQDYGKAWCRLTKRVLLAHRFTFTLLIGPIPTGLTLDHLCRTPRCVNPDHLEPCTKRENILRSKPGALEGRCKRGHVLDRVKKNGTRGCTTCGAEREHLRARRRKAAA